MQGAWELWVIQVLKLFSLQGVLSLTTFQNCQGCDELADSDQGRAGRRLAQQQHVPHRCLRFRDVNHQWIFASFDNIRTRLLTIKHFQQSKGHSWGFLRILWQFRKFRLQKIVDTSTQVSSWTSSGSCSTGWPAATPPRTSSPCPEPTPNNCNVS